MGKRVGSDGLEYNGEWKNDKYHGMGVWKHPDGDRYEGKRIDSWMRDFFLRSHTHLAGRHVKNRRDGMGTYTFANGLVYQGPFKNGKRHGKGTLRDPEGGTLYEAEYVNGERRTLREIVDDDDDDDDDDDEEEEEEDEEDEDS